MYTNSNDKSCFYSRQANRTNHSHYQSLPLSLAAPQLRPTHYSCFGAQLLCRLTNRLSYGISMISLHCLLPSTHMHPHQYTHILMYMLRLCLACQYMHIFGCVYVMQVSRLHICWRNGMPRCDFYITSIVLLFFCCHFFSILFCRSVVVRVLLLARNRCVS